MATGLTLSLDVAEYEGLALRVCVVLVSGETEREVTFDITLGGGSASSMVTIAQHNQHSPSITLYVSSLCFFLLFLSLNFSLLY